MVLGDNLNDMNALFAQDGEDTDVRTLRVQAYAEKWGAEYIVFPNAVRSIQE